MHVNCVEVEGQCVEKVDMPLTYSLVMLIHLIKYQQVSHKYGISGRPSVLTILLNHLTNCAQIWLTCTLGPKSQRFQEHILFKIGLPPKKIVKVIFTNLVSCNKGLKNSCPLNEEYMVYKPGGGA